MRPVRGPEHAVEREIRTGKWGCRSFRCRGTLHDGTRTARVRSPISAPFENADTYLGDVGRKLAVSQVAAAKQLALNLPHIAVALSDPNLQSSCEAYRAWCVRWVTPSREAGEYDLWCAEASPTAADFVQGVP